ncbi:MAG: hypothetical protein M3R45_12475 [Pseudomonadota bacterium]|nr:hypothetical protein [Pseudomonadota bacterium]
MSTLKTLKLRLKDKHAPALVAMVREVNQVWNSRHALSSCAIRELQNKPGRGTASVGIDPGLKTAAACSSSKVLPSRIYRRYAPAMAAGIPAF